MESLEMKILSTLSRPRARRRQYFNSDQLMSILMVALASSVETAWRGSMDSFYLGQEGSEITFGILMRRWDFIGLMTLWWTEQTRQQPWWSRRWQRSCITEVMKKVQEELSDVIGTNNIVEESHLPKLHYLDALIKETFRLHPALPLLVPKHPDRPCVVGGYTIPKNTRVFLNVWAMHRDPEVWDSPLELKPERFLLEASKCDYNGNNFQYLPFGSGRRICAGLPLAEKMVMYFLASLLHSFNWRLPEGEELDLSETFGFDHNA
ncbi:cytochrome P450, family 706, subfamily A, polypeptide 4 [Actinidia rufa]|uniref:Cytochrome P450, family 706, subfamily A, polypeptide 4 n=1 Tax=Actinidia rufa TaxID=165716 RepID=A0A7J0FT88_9ERIC|nr:cytochrome P450, family 706, subfamily A, polypeptide 4 [Actinidia rufa]